MPDPEDAHRVRILLAEDDLAMRQLLVTALRWEGYRVVSAKNGFELLDVLASALLRREAFDLIVSDIRMPGPSGLEVLRGVRDASFRPPPVILITAFGSSDTHARAADLGAAAVLDKPFLLEELIRVVSRILPP